MENASGFVRRELNESIAVKRSFSDDLCSQIASLADRITQSLRGGGKLILFGNGGSAADAQHIAAELVGRYARERRALPALALTTNTSVLTALANDYAFEKVFARQVEAWAEPRDVVVGISTSGNSANVLAGLDEARKVGAFTAALTGAGGGQAAKHCDLLLAVPSRSTPRIQESHITIGHILCEIVERECSKPSS